MTTITALVNRVLAAEGKPAASLGEPLARVDKPGALTTSPPRWAPVELAASRA
jgi:hypothetical protein